MRRPPCAGVVGLAASRGEHGVEGAHDGALVGLGERADVLELLLNLRSRAALARLGLGVFAG